MANDWGTQIAQLQAEFQQALQQVKAKQEALDLKANYLGKKGKLAAILQNLKNLSPEERKLIGPAANEAKDFIQDQIGLKLNDLERATFANQLAQEKIDITVRPSKMAVGVCHGGWHPVTIIQREIEDVFMAMGFEVLDGPHVEDEWHNFDALNTPPDHPARDMQDTFWFHERKDGEVNVLHKRDDPDLRRLLRTHTSAVQIRGMLERKPPLRFIAPGKVFRCERTDAGHEMVFHQCEGMLVGKDISISNLIFFMKTCLREILQKDIDVRLRPGFFPFVEPGFELDIKCMICNGKGCPVCKQSGWVELLPCGMIHPKVLEAGNINPQEWNGFAFGLGLDRLVMMRYGIDDIRLLHSGDLRLTEQFKFY